MNNLEQNNRRIAQQLIDLANDVIADAGDKPRLFNYENPYSNPEFERLAKLEKKFKRSGKINEPSSCDRLRQFCIPVEYIPERLCELMYCIGWLKHKTCAPAPYLKGFYSHVSRGYDYNPRGTTITYYCTVKRYIKLLFMDAELAMIYKFTKGGHNIIK